MSVRVKSFRISNEADEQEMNRFLENKSVRHWSANYAGDPSLGFWNVFIAYEPARDLSERSNNQKKQGDKRAPREEQPKKEKPQRIEQVVDVPEGDMPLYEAVRKWRNARAREANIKPFNLFNNKQLENLVRSKPTSSDELRVLLSDMDQEMFDKYQNELLGFIQGATSGHSMSTEPMNGQATANA